jgi:hypothetical protein
MVNGVAATGRRRSFGGAKHAIAGDETASRGDALLELQRRLAERLIGTRAEFQEAVTCYSVRIQGVLAQVGDVLNEQANGLDDDEVKSRERALRRALDHVESLDLKPTKGRRRDLKAVEVLATDLVDAMADW